MRSALAPTGVAGAAAAMIGVVAAVGVDVDVLAEVVVWAGTLVVEVAVAVGVAVVVVGAGVLLVVVAVALGELVVAVALGVALTVGVAVDLAGVPEVQVTEFPSAERTQVMCDPVLPDGVCAGDGTLDPDPGRTMDGRTVGVTDPAGTDCPGMLRCTELPPGPVVRLTLPGPVETEPSVDKGVDDRDACGKLARATALSAAPRLTALTAGRRFRIRTTALDEVVTGVRAPVESAPPLLVFPAAAATGNTAPDGPNPRAMRRTNAQITLVTRGTTDRGACAAHRNAPALFGPGALRAPGITPMRRPC